MQANNKSMNDIYNIVSNGKKIEYVFVSPYSKKFGNKRTCSTMTFMNCLYDETKLIYDIIDEIGWDNICMAGGLISRLLDYEQIETAPTLLNSDVDLFIYGKNRTLINDKINKLYEKIKEKTQNPVFFKYHYSSVINLITESFHKPVQIIVTNYENVYDLISDFDLSHSQVAWNGQQIIHTPKFYTSKEQRITEYAANVEEKAGENKRNENRLINNKVQAYRLAKAYLLGYDLVKSNKKIYLRNHFDIDYNYDPSNYGLYKCDKIRTFDECDINEILNNEIVEKNLNKHFVPRKGSSREYIIGKIMEIYPSDLIIIDHDKSTSLSTHSINSIICRRTGMFNTSC